MNILKALLKASVALSLAISLNGCDDEGDQPSTSTLIINFRHHVNGNPLEFNKMIYTNAAGNNYEINEVRYFISDLKLYRNNGTIIQAGNGDNIRYIDPAVPETLQWTAFGELPAGTYDSLTFTFGLSAEKNHSFLFVNPPEVNMAWPEVLGGGYHYMMMNGWWNDPEGTRKPMNFHLGIGQLYANNSGDPDDITGFVHNDFTVNPGGGPFTVSPGVTFNSTLTMNIESWFDTPVVYDHNHFGGAIMQNQEAMHTACLNGLDVFTMTRE